MAKGFQYGAFQNNAFQMNIQDVSLTEGIKSGDSNSRSYNAQPAVSEEFILTEELLRAYEAMISTSDVLKISDTNLTKADLQAIISDALKISDGDTAGLVYSIITGDGFNIGEPVKSILLSIFKSISEGIELSDSVTNYLITHPAVSDGIKLSDADLNNIILYLISGDGINLSDSVARELLERIILSLLLRSNSFTLKARTLNLTLPERG